MHMPIRLVNGHQTYSGKCTHVYHPLSIMSITSLKAQYIHKLHYRHLEMLFAQHYVGCTITTGSGISSALPIFLVLQDYLLWTWSEEEEKENFSQLAELKTSRGNISHHTNICYGPCMCICVHQLTLACKQIRESWLTMGKVICVTF